MEIACGILGWTPRAFWTATPYEVLAAFDGWKEAKGQRVSQPINRSRLEEMMAQYPD